MRDSSKWFFKNSVDRLTRSWSAHRASFCWNSVLIHSSGSCRVFVLSQPDAFLSLIKLAVKLWFRLLATGGRENGVGRRECSWDTHLQSARCPKAALCTIVSPGPGSPILTHPTEMTIGYFTIEIDYFSFNDYKSNHCSSKKIHSNSKI